MRGKILEPHDQIVSVERVYWSHVTIHIHIATAGGTLRLEITNILKIWKVFLDVKLLRATDKINNNIINKINVMNAIATTAMHTHNLEVN